MINLKTLIGSLLIVFAIALGFYAASFKDATKEVMVPARELPAKPAPSSQGNEPINAVCQPSNGWNVCSPVEGADFPNFWRNYKSVTGHAIGRYNPAESCQPFAATRICVGKTSSGTLNVNLANAGLEELERKGLRVRSDSKLHLAVADWITGLRKADLDPNRAVGRTISPPICETGKCRQYLDKVVVEFPEASTSGDDVTVVPVEQQRLYPPPPPEIEPAHLEQRPKQWNENYAMLGWGVVAVLLFVFGLALTALGLFSEEEQGW